MANFMKITNITVIGTGYVGLVTGVCFASLGYRVHCVDVDPKKIAQLNQGVPTIYEAGLEALLQKVQQEQNIRFVTHIDEAASQAEIFYITVGTPQALDGTANLDYVLQAARDIGNHLVRECVVVDKSTVPVGTSEKVRRILAECLKERHLSHNVAVVSNPEFLREGVAIDDFLNPERVVIGAKEEWAAEILCDLHRPLVKSNEQIVVMKPQEAELVKYAANCFLATKISFINEMALLCERFDANVTKIKQGMALDSRISGKFLNAGCGYGGSCFPKDVKALIRMGENVGIDLMLLKSVDERNELQKEILFAKLMRHFSGVIRTKIIAVWGLAFKPGTDDMREAPSLVFIREAIKAGAIVQAFDPVAHEQAQKMFPADYFKQQLQLMPDKMAAAKNADALVVMTEWPDFKNLNAVELKKAMKGCLILDGRNIYQRADLNSHGFIYEGIGC